MKKFLIPLGVTVLVLFLAGLGAFIWAALYVNSVATAAQASVSSSSRSPGHPPPPPPSPTSQATLSALAGKVHGSVWKVDTFDVNGQPSVGSAFAVVSDSNQTLLLTSYAVVTAATYQPAPAIQVHQGSGPDKLATLRTWDPAHDLALLVLNEGNYPVLHGTANPSQPGQQVYVMSGAGGANGTITTGKLGATSTGAGLVDDAPQGGAARGGPLIDGTGSVIGIASSSFTPPTPIDVPLGSHIAVPIQDSCAKVLRCPGNVFPTS